VFQVPKLENIKAAKPVISGGGPTIGEEDVQDPGTGREMKIQSPGWPKNEGRKSTDVGAMAIAAPVNRTNPGAGANVAKKNQEKDNKKKKRNGGESNEAKRTALGRKKRKVGDLSGNNKEIRANVDDSSESRDDEIRRRGRGRIDRGNGVG